MLLFSGPVPASETARKKSYTRRIFNQIDKHKPWEASKKLEEGFNNDVQYNIGRCDAKRPPMFLFCGPVPASETARKRPPARPPTP
jgi:hypothetical protein